MNIKAIVKVMNFHALIRVDRARKQAVQYGRLEKEVARMMDIIQNNRNMILDKSVAMPNPKGPRLRIYFGSDLGFCGAVNASVNQVLAEEKPENTVIVIGKKIHKPDIVDFSISRDEFEERYPEIQEYIADGIHNRKYSGIDIFYDHYHNMSHIEPMEKTIFPIEVEKTEKETYIDDFVMEGGDATSILEQLVVTYLNYEIKSAAVNVFASENVLRENATNDSLKRIDEMEEEKRWNEIKIKNQESTRRVIDLYVKTKYIK